MLWSKIGTGLQVGAKRRTSKKSFSSYCYIFDKKRIGAKFQEGLE